MNLGMGQATKTDEFLENFQKRRGSFSIPKNYVADFGPLNRFFFERLPKKGVKGRLNYFPEIHPFL